MGLWDGGNGETLGEGSAQPHARCCCIAVHADGFVSTLRLALGKLRHSGLATLSWFYVDSKELGGWGLLPLLVAVEAQDASTVLLEGTIRGGANGPAAIGPVSISCLTMEKKRRAALKIGTANVL